MPTDIGLGIAVHPEAKTSIKRQQCQRQATLGNEVTDQADRQACQRARRWAIQYCKGYLAGEYLSWQDARDKQAIDRDALRHLSVAFLNRDWTCEELIQLVQTTRYLDPSEFARTHRDILVKIGVL